MTVEKRIEIDSLIPNDMILDGENFYYMNEITFNKIHKGNNFKETVDIVSSIDFYKSY